MAENLLDLPADVLLDDVLDLLTSGERVGLCPRTRLVFSRARTLFTSTRAAARWSRIRSRRNRAGTGC
jgi:hypothetical protein